MKQPGGQDSTRDGTRVAGDATLNQTRLLGLPTLDEKALQDQRELYAAGYPAVRTAIAKLASSADESIHRPLYHVTAKTTCAPSGDPHDYWSVAPYWWPNPDSADGLPYVLRDGERVPGTRLWEAGSEQYDRSALQSMIDETTILALAGCFTREKRYFTRAVALVQTWFLVGDTRMNPHLRYAQVRRGHNGDEGSPSGIIDTNDFYYLLDAARLLEIEEALPGASADGLRQWFHDFRGWLLASEQGRAAQASRNNRGTWYDVQVAAIDSYLCDIRSLIRTLRHVGARTEAQFTPDGKQPEELTRTLSQHYCAYNLQAWVALAHIAGKVGVDIWSYRPSDGRGLARAAQSLLGFMDREWPSREHFDTERLVVLAHEAASRADTINLTTLLKPPQRDPWAVRQVFTATEGIRPYWVLGNSSAAMYRGSSSCAG